MAIATVNPSTGEILATFPPLTAEQVREKIALAHKVFQQYRHISFAKRREYLLAAADILEKEAPQWGKLMTVEMGKPIRAAIAEAQKSALVCRYYGENAQQFLTNTPVATDATSSYVSYQPLGVILAVMPWNFPFWQVFRFAAPALMAGNVGLLKHASNVPQCALAIEEIFQRAGLPSGAFQTLLVGANQVEQIIQDSRVVAATLTGSEKAGASLASIAGSQLKKTVLELGGSDPFIVMASADIEKAVTTAVTARMLNNGQSCIAAKRFILHHSIAQEFTTQLQQRFANLKIGDPMDESVDIGPLATPEILKDLAQQVDKTVEMGAKILIGGHKIHRLGNFYAPTILTQIPNHSPGDQEEFFGPVALLFTVKEHQEAVNLANNTCFGLGASAWTNDPEEKEYFIENLEAGAVFINGMVKSDPRLPFGGIKRSGYGRELGLQGIQEFVNIKTVWIRE